MSAKVPSRARARWKSRVRPDDPRLRIVGEQEQQRFLVAMRMQPQIARDREIDDAPNPFARRRPAVDVELALRRAVRPDERHNPEAWRLRIHELLRAVVGAAGRQDAGNVVATENLSYQSFGEVSLNGAAELLCRRDPQASHRALVGKHE